MTGRRPWRFRVSAGFYFVVIIGAVMIGAVAIGGACSSAEPTPAPLPTPVDAAGGPPEPAAIRANEGPTLEETLLVPGGGDAEDADAAAQAGPQEVAFRTSDGLRLEGTLFRPHQEVERTPPTGVVLAHMFPADQRSWHPFAEYLAAAGFTALAFDFRGYRGSEGTKEIAVIDRDVEAAVDFMLEQGATAVFLIGASMGGTAAVIVASSRDDVAGIVSLSGPRTFRGLDATAPAGSVDVPAMFIAATGDGSAPEAARWFGESVAGPGCAVIVEGSAHGTDLLEGPGAGNASKALLGLLVDPINTSGLCSPGN